MSGAPIIKLIEYDRLSLDRSELGDAEAEFIYHRFDGKVSVEWPSPKTDNKWQLRVHSKITIQNIDQP